jgi:hypothetical protein
VHPLDRGVVDEVPTRKYNQIRELDISSAFGLGEFLLFRGQPNTLNESRSAWIESIRVPQFSLYS